VLKLTHEHVVTPASVFQAIDHSEKWDWKTRLVIEENWSQGSKNSLATSEYLKSLRKLLSINSLLDKYMPEYSAC